MLRDLVARVRVITGKGEASLKQVDQRFTKIKVTAQKTSTAVDQFADDLSKHGGRAVDTFNKMTAAQQRGVAMLHKYRHRIMLVGAAMTAYAGISTKMGADTLDWERKFAVVFGDHAETVNKWIESNAQRFGMSTRAAVQMAGAYADMLVPMGATREQAADMSVQLMETAGALSFFNGVSRERAKVALLSALAGEAEAIKRFGVDIRQTALEEFALAEGLVKSKEELKGFTKMQVVLKKVMLDSTDALTASQDMSGSLNIQMGKLTASVQDFIARGGKPVAKVLAKVIDKGIAPFLDGLLKIPGLAPVVTVLTATLGPLVSGVGGVAESMFFTLKVLDMFGLSISSITDIIRHPILAFRLLNIKLWAGVKAFVANKAAAIANAVANSTAGVAIGVYSISVWGAVAATWAFTTALLANPLTWIIMAIVAAIAALGVGLYFLIKHFDKVKKAFKKFGKMWVNIWKTITGALKKAWGSIVGFFQRMFGFFQNLDIVGHIRGAFMAAWNWIKKYVLLWDIWGYIWKSMKKGWQKFVDGFRSALRWLRNLLPFSPAKDGPLSDLHMVGPGFINTIAGGIMANIPTLRKAINEVSHAMSQVQTAAAGGDLGPEGATPAPAVQEEPKLDLLGTFLNTLTSGGDLGGMLSNLAGQVLGSGGGGLLDSILGLLGGGGGGGILSSLTGLLSGGGGGILDTVMGLLGGGEGGGLLSSVLGLVTGGGGGGGILSMIGTAIGGPIGGILGNLAGSLLGGEGGILSGILGLFGGDGGGGGILSTITNLVGGLFGGGEGGGILSTIMNLFTGGAGGIFDTILGLFGGGGEGGGLLSGILGTAGKLLGGLLGPPPPPPALAGAGGINITVNVTVQSKGGVGKAEAEETGRKIGSSTAREIREQMGSYLLEVLEGSKYNALPDEGHKHQD